MVMSARTTARCPITRRSALAMDPVKFPSIRSMPLKCSSPFRFIPWSKNPEMSFNRLVWIFIISQIGQETLARRHPNSIDKVGGLHWNLGDVWGSVVHPFKHLAMATPLRYPPRQEGPMKMTAWNLIVLSPYNAGLQKLRVSYKAGLILLGAFVFGFCATVALLLLFPHLQVNESEHARLA